MRLMAVLEGTIVKKLKQKEALVESIGKVNCALEEIVRSLCIENQTWQNLARSNEATASALRGNLELVLAQANEGLGDSKVDAGAAESCCCNNNNNNKSVEKEDHLAGNGEWRCRNCEESKSSVLLLPCRHLCLCSGCASAVDTCLICKSTKTFTVQVYLS